MMVAMRTRMRLRALMSLAAAAALGGAAFAAPASADGLIDGGSAIVEPQSSSQCPVGRFCIWTSSAYSGSVYTWSTVGTVMTFPFTLNQVKSVYNNRSARVYIYSGDTGGVSVCYNPGQKVPNVTGWEIAAKSVFLSTYTYC